MALDTSLLAMAARPSKSGKSVAAVALVLIAIACGFGYRLLAGSARHSYSSGAVPPASARVTSGRSYELAAPGGVRALASRGVNPDTLSCLWSAGSAVSQKLSITVAGSGTKATDVIATFVAPTSGSISVDCLGWGAVFVDDANDAAPDVAGAFLVLCVLALAVGLPLGLSAWRDGSGAGDDDSAGAASEDDEIERLVHLVHIRSEDGEVGGGDGGDVRG